MEIEKFSEIDGIGAEELKDMLIPKLGTKLSRETKEYNVYVDLMQHKLNKLGYKDMEGKELKEDGVFGTNTEFAVNTFKETNKLLNSKEYRGKVGQTSYDMLFSGKARRAPEYDDQGTGKYDTLIERLKSSPDDINYQKILKVIEKHGITDFTYEVFQSIVNSEIRGTLESTNYILGNNFKYLAEYNGVSSYANFSVLMVDGEITLIRVGRDKTQVGFYDITKTDFFSQEFDGRDASSIFDDYIPTTGLDTNLNNSKKLSNKNYKFYENKATNTAEIFWKHLKSDSEVIKELARGLDTISGQEDNTGIATDFGDVYKATKYYPQKNNAFVLGEIYGHADGLNKSEPVFITGKNKYRYWVADVENPNTIPTDLITRKKQNQQNARWKDGMATLFHTEIIVSTL